jgi:hypothetical protein
MQQSLPTEFGVRCVVKTDERETASAKEPTSPKKHFGTEWKPPLEKEHVYWDMECEKCILVRSTKSTS